MTLPQGWLSPQEAGLLTELARDKVVLEVGTWLGLSTVTMQKTAKHIVTVDHHHGSPEHQRGGTCYDPTLENQFGEVDTLSRLMANLRQNRARENVTVIVSPFERIALLLQIESFDLVFLDADHSTEATFAHASLADPLLKNGGLFAFHDANWPTVQAAIKQIEWGQPVHEVGSLVVFRRGVSE